MSKKNKAFLFVLLVALVGAYALYVREGDTLSVSPTIPEVENDAQIQTPNPVMPPVPTQQALHSQQNPQLTDFEIQSYLQEKDALMLQIEEKRRKLLTTKPLPPEEMVPIEVAIAAERADALEKLNMKYGFLNGLPKPLIPVIVE